jgi:glutamine phosphoribosylpyrophosphate amidotransferase
MYTIKYEVEKEDGFLIIPINEPVNMNECWGCEIGIEVDTNTLWVASSFTQEDLDMKPDADDLHYLDLEEFFKLFKDKHSVRGFIRRQIINRS